MKRIETELPEVCLLQPDVHADERGYFMETFHKTRLDALGISREWVQDNHSVSKENVLRGMHYQLRHPQAKLVRVTRGAVYDVAVDVRLGSDTFGKHVGVLLSDENKTMMFLPEGFAHGFYVLSPQAVFLYKCSDYYCPEQERGIVWNDPDLAIDWPTGGRSPDLSARDREFRTLADIPQQDLPRLEGSAEEKP